MVRAKVSMMENRISRLSGYQFKQAVVTSTTRTTLLDPTVSELVLLQVSGVESAVQILREADAVNTPEHREVLVEVTAVPTVDGQVVTVGVAEASQRQDEGRLTWRTRLRILKYKVWRTKKLPPVPVDTVIEIDRIQVQEPSTWLLANVKVLASCDERRAKAAKQWQVDCG